MRYGFVDYQHSVEEQLFDWRGEDYFVKIWFNSESEYVIMHNGSFKHTSQFNQRVIKELISEYFKQTCESLEANKEDVNQDLLDALHQIMIGAEPYNHSECISWIRTARTIAKQAIEKHKK